MSVAAPRAVPVVDVLRPPPSQNELEQPATPRSRSVWVHDCIARNLVTGATPDGALDTWVAAGWELVQTIQRDQYEFFYVRRRRQMEPNEAGHTL